MKSATSFPAVQKAYAFLKEKLALNAWQTGEMMPSLNILAQSAGVSKPSMMKAVARLVKEGLVTAQERHRLRAGKADISITQIKEPMQQWQIKRQLVEKDLLYGKIDFQGTLPSVKELQARYGVSFQTIKKILGALRDKGILVPKGKKYARAHVASMSGSWRIVFITMKGHLSQESALNHEHNHIVNIFENESMNRGIHLETMEIDFYNSVESRRAVSQISPDENTLGYILDVWWYNTEAFQQACLDMLNRLVFFKKPVAILDEIGQFSLPSTLCANPLLQVFRIESMRAGEKVGRYLLGLGHRAVAYISHLHHAAWSKERFEGVLSQFKKAGYGESVYYVADQVEAILPGVLTVSGLADQDIRQLMSIGRTPAQVNQLEKDWAEFKNTHQPPYPGYPRISKAMVRNLAGLAALSRHGADNHFVDNACAGALKAVALRAFEYSLEPLVKKAIGCRDATAWVCANDAAAIGAISLLKNKKIKIPQDISVFGFDNVPVQALDNGLTTFDFNAMGFIRLMLNFIQRPPKPRGPYKHSVIEVEGIIIERKTVGKPKKLY